MGKRKTLRVKTMSNSEETVTVELPRELASDAVGVLDGEVRDAEKEGEVYSTEEIMRELSESIKEAI
mgnify:CR=1 FL=1